MCCEISGHHSHGRRHCGCDDRGHHGGPCGCGCGGGFRRFLTKEEKIAELQEYLESLQKEAQAVQEHIAKLQEK